MRDMIVMNDAMRWNEGDDCSRPCGGIRPITARQPGAFEGAAVAGRREYVNRIEGGQYVPDEEHVQVCLNCTRKKCTGYCKDVRSYGRGRKKKAEGEA